MSQSQGGATILGEAPFRRADQPGFALRWNSARPLEGEVRRALANSGYSPLFEVHVSARHGTICLEGRVPTYYLKQIAQTVALSVEGVESLDNELVVG
jgi:osmotically-inducible protein OsmY